MSKAPPALAVPTTEALHSAFTHARKAAQITKIQIDLFIINCFVEYNIFILLLAKY